MIPSRNISLVIQGPTHEESASLEKIMHYLKYFDNIVFSCWVNDAKSELMYPFKMFKDEYVKVLQLAPLDKHRITYCEHHEAEHFCSTLHGIKAIKTGYVVKMRSDESYEKWDFLIDSIFNNPNKLTTNNVFFFRYKDVPFHPSDHIVAGLTRNLVRTYDYLWRMYYNSKIDIRITGKTFGIPEIDKPLGPEQQLCLAYFKANGINVSFEDGPETMKKHVNLVRVAEMGGAVIKNNNEGHTIVSEQTLNLWKPNCINSIEDL